MCGRLKCSVSLDECARSRARVIARQVYWQGEDSTNYLVTDFKSPRKSPLRDTFELTEFKLGDMLVQKVAKQSSSQACAVCRLRSPKHARVDLAGTWPRIVLDMSATSFVVTACGHAFHSAWLYSYLLEPSEQSFAECNKCEIIRALVSINGCSAPEVEAAMELISDTSPEVAELFTGMARLQIGGK